jgi:hypothetical protein
METNIAYNKGWDDAYNGESNKNPYIKNTEDWRQYNEGYDDQDKYSSGYDVAG